MKVQCDVCETAEANVMCCADEAALCAECDSKVHAANKLAGKHQRLKLIYPEPEDLPSCDICQDKAGYFFCLEDRALLCRSCDFSIHSTNALAAKHKRFLVSGTRVALHALLPTNEGQKIVSMPSPLPQQSAPLHGEKLPTSVHTEKHGTSTAFLKSKNLPQVMPMAASTEEVVVVIPSTLASVPVNPYDHEVHSSLDWEMHPTIGGVHPHSMNVGSALASQQGGGGFVRRNSMSEYLTETIPGWKVDELLSLTDAMTTRTFNDTGSSKTDIWSYGDTDWQADYNPAEDIISAQGPAEVPSIPSPPTFSGIPRSHKTWGLGKYVKPSDLDCFLESENGPVVPDVGGVTSPSANSPTSQLQKRQRTALDF